MDEPTKNNIPLELIFDGDVADVVLVLRWKDGHEITGVVNGTTGGKLWIDNKTYDTTDIVSARFVDPKDRDRFLGDPS